jgi:hypothetical protein
MPVKLCRNDNHGRAVVTVRCCPNCGAVVNGAIAAIRCTAESHARMLRSQSAYCFDCGEHLVVRR